MCAGQSGLCSEVLSCRKLDAKESIVRHDSFEGLEIRLVSSNNRSLPPKRVQGMKS